MGDQYLGEIRMLASNFAPNGWALCNGQLLPIAQNQALFALLGTAYGGNGSTTFALPDLRGRRPVHAGRSYVAGQPGGTETVTLTSTQMPAHAHVPRAAATGTQNSPGGGVWAPLPGGYAASPDTSLAAACVAATGGGQPHDNMAPYLVLNFVIAITGIFPSRP
ncbi:phage tail protein [Dactylosporangium vinaceum]|uniref:Phage tail protein n=1 Tax=Dactylosporangium vinaceum TaxID=53362 RepID=A0ABV5ML84_9ACTN|nr:tail fiber protein [Dactylosporangium vinaceum]UAB94081.1 phage tail protein [Dactylosporangium vinaceum]